MCVAGSDGVVRIWDMSLSKVVQKFVIGKQPVEQLFAFDVRRRSHCRCTRRERALILLLIRVIVSSAARTLQDLDRGLGRHDHVVDRH